MTKRLVYFWILIALATVATLSGWYATTIHGRVLGERTARTSHYYQPALGAKAGHYHLWIPR